MNRGAARLVLASVAVLLAVGCGRAAESSPPPNYAKALKDAPPSLARIYSQGDELLSGGKGAFEKRIRSLRGYPVVVNVWASWCGPCIEEFPVFQKVSAHFGDHVAFMGINTLDSEDGASSLLDRTPVPYPSYIDPDGELKGSFEVAGLPATVFFDRSGEFIWRKLGPYQKEEELEADIEKFASTG